MYTALQIYSVHVYNYNGTQHTTLHNHEQEYELFYSIDNASKYICNGKMHVLTPNNALLVKPGLSHRMIASSKGRLIDIKFAILNKQLKAQIDEEIEYIENISEDLRWVLVQIVNSLENNGINSEKLIALNLELFLYMVINDKEQDDISADKSQIMRDLNVVYEHLTPCVQRALPFIAGFVVLPVEPFSISTLAVQCGYDNRYLSQKFKEDIGISITQYYGLLRLNKAKEFLEKTDLSISLISRLLGYTKPAHFMKNFKKYTGMSPSKYRSKSSIK